MGAEFKVGDQVKVALEGEVTRVLKYGGFGDDCFELRIQMYGSLHPHYVYTDSAIIEKAEPPVEVFKPGDIVSDAFGTVRVIAQGGWVRLDNGKFYSTKDAEPIAFTSEHFERVQVG